MRTDYFSKVSYMGAIPYNHSFRNNFAQKPIMTILHISDTHNCHKELAMLPEADVIVHSGDFTREGTEEEAYDFMNWLCDLPYKHKIFIAGNHDTCLFGADNIEGFPDDVHYLCGSGIEIEGIKFWGVPMFMDDVRSGKLSKYYSQIPDDTDILITHQPPKGMCDLADYGNGLEHKGSAALLARIEQLHLRYHFFGHEHDAYEVQKQGNVVFSNASVMDSKYNLINQPRLFRI